jgi:hypothetical protein
MPDLLTERCASLKDVVLELMQLAVRTQSDANLLGEVARKVGQVRSIVALGSAGVDSADYDRWIAVANENLDRMETAVRLGDKNDVWAAFTDPRTGFNLLGQACAGHPGW